MKNVLKSKLAVNPMFSAYHFFDALLPEAKAPKTKYRKDKVNVGMLGLNKLDSDELIEIDEMQIDKLYQSL